MSNAVKKAGILTLNGYNNYGNRLQNYATQEVLKELGFQVETILVDRTDPNSRKLSNRLRKISSINELCLFSPLIGLEKKCEYVSINNRNRG